MVTKPYWTDSWTAWVIENHKQPSDGTKNYAPATTRLQPKITLISRQRQSGAEMKILGTLYLTLRVKTDLWNNKTITKKLKKLKRDCMRSMEKGNTRIHTKDQGRQRRSEQFTGTEEGSERVDRKTDWKWYDHPSTSSSSSSWQAASWWKSTQWDERFFFLQTQGVFAYRQWRFPCKRREVSTGHQTRTQCRVPAHVIFLAQCSTACLVSVSHMHNMCMGLKKPHGSSHNGVLSSQKHLPSHLAQHGTQYTFSDDSAIIEHSLTSHLHSDPPFDQTINGTPADFIFWRGLPLRRSNKCVFRFLGRSALACRSWAQRSCRRGQSCAS